MAMVFDEKKALEAVSACLEKTGSRQFNPALIDLATGVLGADQCMIFSYGAGPARCFLSYNNRPKGEARALAEAYVTEGSAGDPIRDHMRDLPDEGGVCLVPLEALKQGMDAAYWARFFEAPGLVDKLAIPARKHGLTLCLNFYRYEESGPFGRGFLADAAPVFRSAAHLALLHYHSSDDHSLEDPLLTLSAREEQVCRWILKGLTTEAIAYEMALSPNTISTFRKRAYDKLGINSKPALFALCGGL